MNTFPSGWDENQTDEEAVAEDEAAYQASQFTLMMVPVELVPAVRQLIADHDKVE